MLAVVEQHEALAVGEHHRRRVERLEPERVDKRLGAGSGRHRGEQPDRDRLSGAVEMNRDELRCEPALADPTWSGQGDDAAGGRELGEPSPLGVTADETR